MKSPSYPTWPQLKQEFEYREITHCEVCPAFPEIFTNCNPGWLTPAHRLKRRFYTSETVWTFAEVVIACINAHQLMEKDKDLTRKVFSRLRPEK